MSFQITVLKVLSGHPGGRASLIELRCAVAILISSGKDWTARTKRLAARAPGIDIFSQSFVLRDEAGWLIISSHGSPAIFDFFNSIGAKRSFRKRTGSSTPTGRP
jgi:hypothetical protein